jgi:hypothetical protein
MLKRDRQRLARICSDLARFNGASRMLAATQGVAAAARLKRPATHWVAANCLVDLRRGLARTTRRVARRRAAPAPPR